MRYREKTEILRMFTATITARYWKHTYIWKTVGFKTMKLFNTIKFEQFKHCENKPLQSEINDAAFSAAICVCHKNLCFHLIHVTRKSFYVIQAI